ncbi:MAG: T9SS type A sorting domain-containing protein [Muribaculaceae bacterium]|nr:T9SS type A sorting domain-containing protein [Muribaculaceae bacterium]
MKSNQLLQQLNSLKLIIALCFLSIDCLCMKASETVDFPRENISFDYERVVIDSRREIQGRLKFHIPTEGFDRIIITISSAGQISNDDNKIIWGSRIHIRTSEYEEYADVETNALWTTYFFIAFINETQTFESEVFQASEFIAQEDLDWLYQSSGIELVSNESTGFALFGKTLTVYSPCSINISSISGAQILHQESTSHQASEIDLTHINSGIYILTISTPESTKSYKICLKP